MERQEHHGLEWQPCRRRPGVIAAEALACASSKIERAAEIVGVRSGCVIDHRVGALLHELRIGPSRALAAGVLGQIDLVRAFPERLRRVWRVEVDLGHLPVALVLVREVVERVVEPVLDRQLARICRVGGDMRVDARLATVIPGSELPLVAAAGIERIAREIDVVADAVTPQIAAVGARVTTSPRESRRTTCGLPRMMFTLVGRYASPGPHGLR